jgi:lactate racemase
MKVGLQYGRGELEIEIDAPVNLIVPRFIPGVVDEVAAFREAVRRPHGTKPLGQLVAPGEKLAVVIPDGTRAFPADRVLPLLFEELKNVDRQNITIIVGTGTHRPNTHQELAEMLGEEILARYRVVNHDAYDRATQAEAGMADDGRRVRYNADYVKADRRIICGFIEPHFFAGYSGGYKAVFPAVADIDSIMHYHRAGVIGDPQSTWDLLDDNPTQQSIRRYGSLLPVDFCINVTLNRKREITSYFCGEVLAAHVAGCAFARASAMAPCPERYRIVITTNGGYPLDQNLYQSVKGMSAADQIVADGGTIIVAAECADGLPEGGNFVRLLNESPSLNDLLKKIELPGFAEHDQWQVQKMALIARRARVAVYSSLPAEKIRSIHLEPISDLQKFINKLISGNGPTTPVAVLPEGPMTIPYIA